MDYTTLSIVARTKLARIRQIGSNDGYQWNLLINGRSAYAGMTRSEASWRRTRFIQTGVL